MRSSIKMLLVSVLLGSSLSVYALEEHHPEGSPAQAPSTDMPSPPKAMHEQMQKMQAAHDKLAAAKTPAERQAAMQESLQTMRASMGMMRGQAGAGCMGMMGAGMGMPGAKDGAGMAMPGAKDGAGPGMPMMDMMMKMLDQHAAMLAQPK